MPNPDIFVWTVVEHSTHWGYIAMICLTNSLYVTHWVGQGSFGSEVIVPIHAPD